MSTNTHTRNFRRRSRSLESSEKASALKGPEGITQLALNIRSAFVSLSAHAAFIHHFGWRPNGDGLRQTKPNKSPLRQFIKTEKLNITINRAILVNTFLSLDLLQLLISIEQLLLGLPPLRILLQQKIPNSIRSGIKLDLKTGLCRFLRISTAEWEVEPSAKT